jgi:hypothetical protein
MIRMWTHYNGSIYKIIPLNLCWEYFDGSFTKQYQWIGVEGITMNRSQNNTSWHMNANRLRVVLSVNIRDSKKEYYIGSIPKQYPPNQFLYSMTCAHIGRDMRYYFRLILFWYPVYYPSTIIFGLLTDHPGYSPIMFFVINTHLHRKNTAY